MTEGDSSDDGGGQLHVLIQAGELQSEQGSSRQSRHIGLEAAKQMISYMIIVGAF